MTTEGAAPAGGSVAEETARLFEAVQEWARRSSVTASAHVATGSPECQLCPVCQLIGLLREARPEVAAHLVDAAASLMAAARAAVVAHEREWSSRRDGGIERIDIG